MPIDGRNYLFKNIPECQIHDDGQTALNGGTQPLLALSRPVEVIICRLRLLAPHSVQSGPHPFLHDFGREQ